MSATSVHRLVLPLAFPEGLRPGAGKDASNLLLIARDGADRPVLRGTALAGSLRHALARRRGVSSEDVAVARWFGRAANAKLGDEHGESSRLRVSDVVLAGAEPQLRHHIAVDRHSGAVRDGSLFSLEALGPGTSGTAILELHEDDADLARELLAEIVGIVEAGLTVGGSAARGIGRAQLSDSAMLRQFDLASVGGHADFLDERLAVRSGVAPSGGAALAGVVDSGTLRVELVLAVPRGQDLLVADGQALDCQMEPQVVVAPDGSRRWRLPGSAIRGVLRGWVNRLARRDGSHGEVADTAQRFVPEETASGEQMGWGFATKEKRKETRAILEQEPTTLEARVPCPVMRLFGSLYSRGRVHVADAFSAVDVPAQRRAHVAVDRVTGGANEGFFFDNDVVTSSKVRFEVVLTVERPEPYEAQWLAASVRAIDAGLLRIGSSKAGGRLALAATPKARGPHAEAFSQLQPCEPNHV